MSSIMTVKDAIVFDKKLCELIEKIKKADGLQRGIMVRQAIDRLKTLKPNENTESK